MKEHHVQLNLAKTELLVFPATPNLQQVFTIQLGSSTITPSTSVRNLGVISDDQLTTKGHIAKTAQSCRFALHKIRKIGPFLTVTNLVASHHTATAHHPWTTTPIIHCTHTFPSTITPITQLSPITHQPWLSCHTCTSFTHPHISSTLPYTRCEVLFLPRLTFLSVYHPLWLLLLCLTPDCLTLELWTCACDLDPRLVLFTSLLCLWYSCYCPLTIACLILPLPNKYINCTWIHTPLTSLYRRLRQTRIQQLYQETLARYGPIRPAARPETGEFIYCGVHHSILWDNLQGTLWWGHVKGHFSFWIKWAY